MNKMMAGILQKAMGIGRIDREGGPIKMTDEYIKDKLQILEIVTTYLHARGEMLMAAPFCREIDELNLILSRRKEKR